LGKWTAYNSEIIALLQANESMSNHLAAQTILKTTNTKDDSLDVASLTQHIRRNRAELLDKNEGIYNATEELDVPNTKVKHLWLKNKTASLFVKNPDYVDSVEANLSNLKNDLIIDLQAYSPKFDKIDRIENADSYLLVIDPADIHIGKLCSAFETGEDYNNQIAVTRVLEGVKGILQKISSFNIDKILFIGGNDILHVDNPKRTTTAGTSQDTDGMWYDNFLIAKQLYIDILELLLSVADVHFTFNPSNHDYTNGFFLAQVIETYFKNCQNITFDCSIAHRKTFKYYNNLIGTTHGDGAKLQDLPLLMAVEFSNDWAATKHRYVYTHHVHHKTSKDYAGITIESLRSPSGTDSWHYRNGYLSIKAIEAFLHCKHNGQIARITHIF
jgi:hypothetical protein